VKSTLRFIGIALMAATLFSMAACGTASKPTPLAADATYAEFIQKCDQFVAYCNANSGEANSAMATAVNSLKSSASETAWKYAKGMLISGLNSAIERLP